MRVGSRWIYIRSPIPKASTFSAIINSPQGMILAAGAAEKRPRVVGDEVVAATIMTATGSFDHRVIDGVVGAQLMDAFKTLLEKPTALII